MATKTSRKKKAEQAQRKRDAWKNVLLALTLVPLVIGVLLVVLWAGLDIDLWDARENQVVVGTLFILLSFGLSNAVQKNWMASAGWLLLMAGDAVLLTTRNLTVQIASGVLGGLGLIFLIVAILKKAHAQETKQASH